MQTMTLRQFAIDESSPHGRGSAHAIGEGQEPPKQHTAFTRMRNMLGAAPRQTPGAHGDEIQGSTAYGTRTLEEIMDDGVPESTSQGHVRCHMPCPASSGPEENM